MIDNKNTFRKMPEAVTMDSHSTLQPNQDHHPQQAFQPGRGLRVSAYEHASGLLTALLILVSFFVLILFTIWLTTYDWRGETSLPVLVGIDTGGDAVPGIADELEEPGAEEIEELVDPQLKETREAVTDIASTIAASVESIQGNSKLTAPGSSLGRKEVGVPGGHGLGATPRWERWKIQYPPLRESDYASLLDELGIEIGCFGGSQAGIDIIANLSRPAPVPRKVSEDERLYFRQMSESGNLAIDRQLLKRAGVATSGRIVVHFYPPEVENELAWVEKDFHDANGKYLKDVKQTVFGLRPLSGTYEFFVIDQQYR